jgi:hypothetical protein
MHKRQAPALLVVLMVGLCCGGLLFGGVAFAKPNQLVHPGAPPGEHNNPSVAWSETTLGEVYVVYTEYPAPGTTPTFIGHAFSPIGGAPGSWINLGPILPTGPYTEEWNPTIAAANAGGFFYSSSARVGKPYAGSNGIIVNLTAGAGAPFVPPAPAVVMTNIVGFDWLDYPNLAVDAFTTSVAPNRGSLHLAWVEYVDLDGDPNGDGNPINDNDEFHIWYSYSNTLPGPSPFPGFSLPIDLTGGPMLVLPGSHPTHRPEVEIVGNAGTPPPTLFPVGAVYVCWTDGFRIFLEASTAPASGAPWGALGASPFFVGPVVPIPPVLNGGIQGGSSVTIAYDDGPKFAGNLYIAWSDMFAGVDADILFISSGDGGLTWSPPVRVTSDPVGNGADQWAPSMNVDPVTGNIYIAYYDRRNDPLNLNREVWVSLSQDGGLTWCDRVISDAGPTPPISTIANGLGVLDAGDYINSDVDRPNRWGFVWNDGRNGADEDVFFEDASSCCVLAGDVNADGFYNIADGVFIVNNVFKGGPGPSCYAAADTNGDCNYNISDAVLIINNIFKGGPPPICSPCECLW